MSTNITAFAGSSNNNSTITYFEDGMYCITTMELDDSNISVCSTTKTGTKTSTYYNSSDTAVCAIKLTGAFSYEAGSYVECTNVSYKTLQYDSNSHFCLKRMLIFVIFSIFLDMPLLLPHKFTPKSV